MPKKFFKRWMPTRQKLLEMPRFKVFGKLLEDPNLLHLNRHSVSLAFLVGLFSAFLPLPGQTFIVALLCFWARANLPIGVALIWVTNPITIPPIFFGTYKLGTWILGTEPLAFKIELTLDWFLNTGAHYLIPLLLGSILCGLVAGVTGYYLMQYLWRRQVVINWEKRKQAREARKP